jgi:RsiW-degrading membrane proteinase PrsW (M82 family)
MSYFLFLILSLAPSLIWLLYFLRKDVHPEPKLMVLTIFLWGALITLPAIFIERGILEVFRAFDIPKIFYIFLGIAGVEEILKFVIVKEKVIFTPEFDEPLDAPLYMIISALGFAALENLLFFYSPDIFFLSISEILILASFRFITATFLHALCSGLVGFFLALSFFETKKRFKLEITGLTVATLLHGIYNLSLMTFEGWGKILVPAIILVSLAFILSLSLQRLKIMKSICQPDITFIKKEIKIE